MRPLPLRNDRSLNFALPPITSARDAADISAAVIDALSHGVIDLGEAAEVAELIDAYVKAYKAAELDDRVAGVEQLTRAELMRIAPGGLVDPAQPASKTAAQSAKVPPTIRASPLSRHNWPPNDVAAQSHLGP